MLMRYFHFLLHVSPKTDHFKKSMTVIYGRHLFPRLRTSREQQQGSKASTDNDENQNRKFAWEWSERCSLKGQDIGEQWTNIF